MKPWKEFLETNSIKEEAPANAAGPMDGGDIAGIGTGPQGEPGFDPKKKKKKSYYDGRTTGYRFHREKLEAAREKREERRVAKEKEFVENIKNKTENVTFRTDAIRPGYPVASPMAAMHTKKKKK